MASRTIGEKSADTAIIESLLRQTPEGDVLTYDEMSIALGRDVREFCKGNLYSARRILLNSDGIATDAVRGEGVKRLTSDGVLGVAKSDCSRVRRASNTTLRKLGTVDFETLVDSNKSEHIALSAQMGAVAMFTKTQTRKVILNKSTNSQLAIGETLQMFVNSK